MAQGGTNTWWSMLLRESLTSQPANLVIWEYSMNDGFKCPPPSPGAADDKLCILEAFLLDLLSLPTPPAVLMIFLWACDMVDNRRCSSNSFDQAYFTSARPMLEQFAKRLPLLAINVPSWLNHSRPDVLPKAKARDRFHPSELLHATLAEELAHQIMESTEAMESVMDDPPLSAAVPVPGPSATAASSPGSPADLFSPRCSALGASTHLGGELLRLRVERHARSFLSWSPNASSASGLLLPSEPYTTSLAHDFKCVEGRGDCKHGAQLPACSDGFLSFELVGAPHVAAVHWKLQSPVGVRVHASHAEGASLELSAQEHNVDAACLRTVSVAKRSFFQMAWKLSGCHHPPPPHLDSLGSSSALIT